MRLLFLFTFLPVFISAQYSLSGRVVNDQEEGLPFALVFLENTAYSTLTNAKGYFQMKEIPKGNYSAKIQFVGYPDAVLPISLKQDTEVEVVLSGGIYDLSTIEIQGNRIDASAPFSHTMMDKTYLRKENLGQDLTVLMQWQPSVVVTSDAGAGVGYTSMLIRGSDQTRINVTLNGVPVNDAESHNVFWVNMPNLAGSTSSIQIQRGVGTSTSGAGAFGGTVSINTHDIKPRPYVEVDGSLGSFQTHKASVGLGSGLINGKYFVEGRFSNIGSAGFIDRASSNLNSIYFTAGRVTPKSSLRFNYLDGREVTYQSWNGAPEALVKGDSAALRKHYDINRGSIYQNTQDSVNLFNSGRTYNYYTYPNQVDNYNQTHYQLLYSYNPSESLKIKSTLFYTRGKGYFEQFRYEDILSNYGIPDVMLGDQTFQQSTIVRRRWLDNHFTGMMVEGEYTGIEDWTFQTGLNAAYYTGDHFGDIVTSSVDIPDLDMFKKYYDNVGQKEDYMGYARSIWTPTDKLTIHADLQLRFVDYAASGINNDRVPLDISASHLFFNPKAGLSYNIRKDQQLYLSYAVAQKEPTRRDFTDNTFDVLPRPEKLQNIEAGYRMKRSGLLMESNIYYMRYTDQLVLTGELNDVGAPIRVNVPESYRLGLENSINIQWSKKWTTGANLTLSRNKIVRFDEVVADYTQGFDKVVIPHENTDISFSPDITGALQIGYQILPYLGVEWSSKYVGRQFLDNTSSLSRSLDAYHFHNLRIACRIPQPWLKEANLTVMINNITNNLYSSNGYTYTYIFEEQVTENFLYPQAGIHFLMGLNIKL